MIIATTRKTIVQGLDCYLPALRVKDGDSCIVYISRGDPLVTRKSALKYAKIWRLETMDVGYVTFF